MTHSVIILGAGASKDAGAPLMDNFIDVAERLKTRAQTGGVGESFNLMFDGLAELRELHEKAAFDTHNIESVFAAFEMAKLLGRLGRFEQDKIDKLPDAMRDVIVQTISETVKFSVVTNTGRPASISAPFPYPALVDLIKTRAQQLSRDVLDRFSFSIITFNYDICLDFGFYQAGINIRYGLENGENPDAVPLLKLHGSLNWGRCSKCKKVVAWHMANLRNLMFDLESISSVRLPVTNWLKELEHCGGRHIGQSYVVPPTWNKAQYHTELESVWRNAAKELQKAENIFVSGYSLPGTDQFFRLLYALGTSGTTRLKKFWVFDPAASVEASFRDLIGESMRHRFKFFKVPFAEMMPTIQADL